MPVAKTTVTKTALERAQDRLHNVLGQQFPHKPTWVAELVDALDELAREHAEAEAARALDREFNRGDYRY